jgi:hypothetical protein
MPTEYRRLDEESIVRTIERLHRRVEERFPGRGVTAVCADLLVVSHQHIARAHAAARPATGLRALVGFVLVLGAGLLTWLIWQKVRLYGINPEEFNTFEGVEAIANIIVLTSAGVWFLLNLETRLKRERVLSALHELRALAHVIDMHQLTKDPPTGEPTASSPERDLTTFQLGRYLDYCAEMLSLIGKLAALYMQQMNDPVIIQAANDIERLTGGFSEKIWQKLIIINDDLRQAKLVAAAPPQISKIP